MENIRRIVITGCNGRLGRELVRCLVNNNKVFAVSRKDFDITNVSQMRAFVTVLKPNVIINAAANANVDSCESDEKAAYAVNSAGCRNLATMCRESDIRLISYSTDYVFDGTAERLYTENDRTNPINAYGRSKLEGEQIIAELLDDYLILRVSWLYGSFGASFVSKIIEKGRSQIVDRKKGKSIDSIPVVDDQIGNPTWTREVAFQTERLLDSDMKGVAHCTSEAAVSWYQFAVKLFELLELEVTLHRCSAADCPRPAARPRFSSLENARLNEANLSVMSPWDVALERFLVVSREAAR